MRILDNDSPYSWGIIHISEISLANAPTKEKKAFPIRLARAAGN